MANFRRLLTRGFFPVELPQPFHTKLFGRAITRRSVSLPAGFTPPPNGNFRSAEIAKHNLARVGRLRRVLGIPNPIIFYNQALEIVQSWTDIQNFLNQSSLSVTHPTATRTGLRAIGSKAEPPDFPRLRALHRANGRYLLLADIQQFYPSLYTHSLPWALHTKAVAKAERRNFTLLGNRLDRWAQRIQDSQTRGIPIGPDTSRVLAEILLTSIDIELERRIGILKGFRAVDDYELTFRHRSEAENALGVLQSILSDYELELNGEKTCILELPLSMKDTWSERLRNFEFRDAPRAQIQDLISYFSLAFELARQYPTQSVLRYAIARVSSENLRSTTWLTYQDLLIQSAVAEPGTLKYVLSELSRYQQQGCLIIKDKIQEALDELILRHQPLCHGSEVAWAIWIAISLDIPLLESSVDKISEIEDTLIPLLALHANSKGLMPSGLNITKWASLMTRDELWGQNWLLCYEANIKGWLPSATTADHVNADPCFSFLKAQGVSFYDYQASSVKIPKWRPRFSFYQLMGYGLE